MVIEVTHLYTCFSSTFSGNQFNVTRQPFFWTMLISHVLSPSRILSRIRLYATCRMIYFIEGTVVGLRTLSQRLVNQSLFAIHCSQQ